MSSPYLFLILFMLWYFEFSQKFNNEGWEVTFQNGLHRVFADCDKSANINIITLDNIYPPK